MKVGELKERLLPLASRLDAVASAPSQPLNEVLGRELLEYSATSIAGQFAKAMLGRSLPGKRAARKLLHEEEVRVRNASSGQTRTMARLIAKDMQVLLAADIEDIDTRRLARWRRQSQAIAHAPESVRIATLFQQVRALLQDVRSATARVPAKDRRSRQETRDNFSVAIKRSLADRVGHRCSNPECRASTSGPTVEVEGIVHVGVAAHITAASSGGPRYDAELTQKTRSGPWNGIFLCQNCAKRIDDDATRYDVPLLQKWKAEAEEEQRRKIGRTAAPLVATRPSLGWHVDGQMTNALRARGAQVVGLVLAVPEPLTNLRWRLTLDERLRASLGKPSTPQQEISITEREATGWIGQAPGGLVVMHDAIAVHPREPFDGNMTYMLQADEFGKPYSGVLHVRAK